MPLPLRSIHSIVLVANFRGLLQKLSSTNDLHFKTTLPVKLFVFSDHTRNNPEDLAGQKDLSIGESLFQ